MKTKKFSLLAVMFFSLFIVLNSVFLFTNNISAFAYSEENYRLAGINFLKEQYMLKDLKYDSLEVEDSINLYDFDENVNAKILILNRDSELDYVVLDFTADDIISFGFNSYDYLQNFYGKDRIYYVGLSNFAYLENGLYYNISGELLDSALLLEAWKEYKAVVPEAASGYDGILSWSEVLSDANSISSSISNSADDFIPGFTRTGLDSKGAPLNYYAQNVFNAQYNNTHSATIKETCGPTAMTNMAVYFRWLGYPRALINYSTQETFEWFLNDLDWFNWTGENWWTNTKNSFVNYADAIGYNYSITNYDNPSINDFTTQINNDCPLYTYLNVTEHSGSTWSHAVVTVGYEKFTHSYQVNKRWWLFGWHDKWVTQTEDYYYLRCIDGWSTSESGQYIKFNFYTTYRASAFILK